MEIGISLNMCNMEGFKDVKGYDFMEISDFIFPQFICDRTYIERYHSIMSSNRYNVKSLQGPIRDIKPESGDPDVLRITKDRFATIIRLGAEYGVKYILFNTTFDNLVKFDFYTNMWLQNNKRFWEEIIPIAEENKIICLYSNVWDDAPNLLHELFSHINSECFRFGFDIGHMNYVSRVPMEEWFEVLGDYTDYIAVHDNFGQRDDHISIGEGTIDFHKVMREIGELKKGA